MNRMLLCVLCLGAVAMGGAVEKRYVPFCKAKCVLLYEVKDVHMLVYKCASDTTGKLAIMVTFIQRKAAVSSIKVTAEYTDTVGKLVSASVDIQKVKAEEPTVARIVADLPLVTAAHFSDAYPRKVNITFGRADFQE
ncbi:MAG TPA: hypothetical protein VNE39_21600 [Planctomycetota bacterium]|nr:hypothetical protein [Planctomycetota bacterium]